MSAIENVLAALYLRGLPRPVEPHPRSWPAVLSTLRRAAITSAAQATDALRATGFTTEAACLGGPTADHAERLVESQLAVTVASDFYPRVWVEKLGAGAPPALYARGALELLSCSAFAVVGSRNPPHKALCAAAAVSQAAFEAGFVVTSGGAPGVDRAAGNANAVIELWPCGLGVRWGIRAHRLGPILQLSAWPPRELFSVAGAMERNTLVYALSDAAYVGHARFKQGGSWHGATAALRRRLTRVLVSAAPWSRTDEAARQAFIGLGAIEVADATAAALAEALAAAPLQPWLPSLGYDPAVAGAVAAY
ncbi:MAG: DNA-processing protein DprA [Fimbriimonadaceae bacterium]